MKYDQRVQRRVALLLEGIAPPRLPGQPRMAQPKTRCPNSQACGDYCIRKGQKCHANERHQDGGYTDSANREYTSGPRISTTGYKPDDDNARNAIGAALAVASAYQWGKGMEKEVSTRKAAANRKRLAIAAKAWQALKKAKRKR